MGGDGLATDEDVPVFGAGGDAGDEGAAGRLALPRRGEHDRQPHVLSELVALAEEGADVGSLPRYRVPAARAGADKHEAAHQVRPIEGDQLGDLAAHRVTEEVDGRQPEAVDEAGGAGGDALDGVRGGSGAAADPGVVEQDDLTSGCQRVGDGGVEVVEVTHEVLGEDQRGAGAGPEAAVGEPSVADVEEPGGGGEGQGCGHD
ncbi:MAG TPA: hypothetical protein VIZ43_03815 [Trebonia sp.]